ncbi:MarR family winged helix-turn-helix transcriptional regulator [Pusillimonas sp.]|uniref:MarR family winged helix-turn-helix transcriptional regulator n=1 Tax=Pusillimonas sp. TaxID=3040095 RepID=UPI0037CBF8CF
MNVDQCVSYDENQTDAMTVPVGFEVQQLLSHLLRRAHFYAESEFVGAYPGLDATSRQLALLFTINRMPGATQIDLAQAVGIDSNTFSDLAKRSEQKGLLKRVRMASDRRAWGLYLTELGRSLVAQAAILTPDYQNSLARRLSEQEALQLVSLLKKMLDL